MSGIANVNVKAKAFGQDGQSGSDSMHRVSRASKVRQVLDIQDVLKAIVMNPETKPLECASCARSWDLLEERLRILRGKPLPGQLQPDGKHKVKKGRRTIGIITPESVADSMKIA